MSVLVQCTSDNLLNFVRQQWWSRLSDLTYRYNIVITSFTCQSLLSCYCIERVCSKIYVYFDILLYFFSFKFKSYGTNVYIFNVGDQRNSFIHAIHVHVLCKLPISIHENGWVSTCFVFWNVINWLKNLQNKPESIMSSFN